MQYKYLEARPDRASGDLTINPTATLARIARICPCKMAVLQGQAISVMPVGSANNSLCYRVCSCKCRCRVKMRSPCPVGPDKRLRSPAPELPETGQACGQ